MFDNSRVVRRIGRMRCLGLDYLDLCRFGEGFLNFLIKWEVIEVLRVFMI